MFLAISIVINGTIRHALRVQRNLTHTTLRAQFHTGAQRCGPIGDIRTRLGALRAAGRAMAEIDAFAAPIIIR